MGTAAAFAAPVEKTVIMDDSFDLSSIHTIAIAMPNYIENEKSPKLDEVIKALAQSGFDSRSVKHLTIIPYSVIAKNIQAETGKDLQTLDKNEAKSLFTAQVKKYADAYLVLTAAKDSRVVMFYDLYSAKDNKYLYSYEVIGGGQGDNNLRSYTTFNDMFYDAFAQSVKDQKKTK